MRDFTIASENIASAVHNGLIHNGHPTYQHLVEVVSKTLELEPTASDEIIASAWLHDTLKYTSMTSTEISKITTCRVARICELVTDPGGKILSGGKRKGAIRKQVKTKLYNNFLNENDESIKRDAAFIKCVDRFVNQHNAVETWHEEKIKIYIEEFPKFIKVFGLHLKSNREKLWFELFNQYAEMIKLC